MKNMTNNKRFICKKILVVLFCAYCIFIIWYTLLSRTSSGRHQIDMRFMWSYYEWFIGKQGAKKNVIQNIANIVFFVPFGFFLSMIIKEKITRKVLVYAGLFSLFIELTQYFACLGLCELDDIVCNSLGALIGLKLKQTICKDMNNKR